MTTIIYQVILVLNLITGGNSSQTQSTCTSNNTIENGVIIIDTDEL